MHPAEITTARATPSGPESIAGRARDRTRDPGSIQPVEPADPGADREPEQPGSAPPRRLQPASRRPAHSHREPEEELRVGVYRFASEYQKTIPSATGDSAKQRVPSFHAANTNTAEEATTNTPASPRVMRPRGSSRPAVRGLSASYEASASRLKPMAALRAATIATTIQQNRSATDEAVQPPTRCNASNAPVNANGSAKTEWLNRTKDA